MLFKLAFRNVKRQIGNYLVYFITLFLTVALIFSLNNMLFGDLVWGIAEQLADFVRYLLIAFAVIVGIVVAFVLSFATAFLLRRRKREFGLYLTLGMTRKNILAIFAGETLVLFALSLGVGIPVGMAMYQLFAAVISNYLRLQYTAAGYSGTAFWFTILLVGGVFVLASVASLGYLRFSKISALLHGDKKREKTPKLVPAIIWLVVCGGSVAGIYFSITALGNALFASDFFNRIPEIAGSIVFLLIFVFLVAMGFSRSLIALLMRIKPLMNRGATTFTLRQLSGTLNANSVMLGILTLLLSIALVMPNFLMFQNNDAETWATYWNPYKGIIGGVEAVTSDDVDPLELYDAEIKNVMHTINDYAKVQESHSYTLYSYETDKSRDIIVKESDFKKLCGMLGYSMPSLNGGCLECNTNFLNHGVVKFSYSSLPSGMTLTVGGNKFERVGELECPEGMINSGAYSFDKWIVLPDDAVSDKKISPYRVSLAVTLVNNNYNAVALKNALNAELPSVRFVLWEWERIDSLTPSAMFFMCELFLSVTFILLTMAMLALKILAMVSEDKEKYKVLWRLGASNGTLGMSLFWQIFVFYFLPFLMPFALCVPFGKFIFDYFNVNGRVISQSAIFTQVFGLAGGAMAIYALYFTVTFIVAWLDIKKSLNSASRG